MKIENLDLFKDLMEQAKVKAQCDAEEMMSDSDGDSAISGAIDGLLNVLEKKSLEGLDVHITANGSGEGVGVAMCGNPLSLSLATVSMIDAFFNSMKKDLIRGNRDAWFIKSVVSKTVTLIMSHMAENLKEFNSLSGKGDKADE